MQPIDSGSHHRDHRWVRETNMSVQSIRRVASDIDKLDRGVEEWNAWRRSEPNTIPNLRGENLSERSLRGIDLE
jgi:hypothetical protein